MGLSLRNTELVDQSWNLWNVISITNCDYKRDIVFSVDKIILYYQNENQIIET